MDYSFLNKKEYSGIPIYRISQNNNGLPFFIIKMDQCNQEAHRHEYVQIIYICKGRIKHVIDTNRFDLFKGDVFVIPPYVPHYFIRENGEKFELIEFEFMPEYINENFSIDAKAGSFFDFAYLEPFLVAEMGARPRLNLTGSVQLEVENILSEILREYNHRDIDFALVIKALLLKLLVILSREFRRETEETESPGLFEKHRDALHAAVKYINDNYCTDITINEAAKVAILSPSYFSCLFKQLTGKTFTEYVNGLRIAKAVELLKNRPDMKIVDICFAVGYNNVNHFNRMFKQEIGTTPMKLRKHL